MKSFVMRQFCSRALQVADSCIAARANWLPPPSRQAAAQRQRQAQQLAAVAGQQEAAAQQQPAGPQAEQPAASGATDDDQPRFEQLSRLTHLAHELWTQFLRSGDTVVDATCGNGNDTLFLARAVGPTGTVHAFDIQAAAIQSTQQLLGSSMEAGQAPAVQYHHASHAEMLERVGSSCARVIVFNLGYLPGSDKSLTTQESSTVAAVQAACEVLMPGGLLSLLCYTKHPGGQEEYEAVKALVGDLPPASWVSSEIRLLNRPTAPVLLLVWKRATA